MEDTLRSYDTVLARGPMLRYTAFCLVKGILRWSFESEGGSFPLRTQKILRKRARRAQELGITYSFWDEVAGLGKEHLFSNKESTLFLAAEAAGVSPEELASLLSLFVTEMASGYASDENRLLELAPVAIGVARGLFLNTMSDTFRTEFAQQAAENIAKGKSMGGELGDIHEALKRSFAKQYPFRFFVRTFPAVQVFAHRAGNVDPHHLHELFLLTLTDLALPYEELEKFSLECVHRQLVLNWIGREPRKEPITPEFWSWPRRALFTTMFIASITALIIGELSLGVFGLIGCVAVMLAAQLLKRQQQANKIDALYERVVSDVSIKLELPVDEVRGRVPTLSVFATMLGTK